MHHNDLCFLLFYLKINRVFFSPLKRGIVVSTVEGNVGSTSLFIPPFLLPSPALSLSVAQRKGTFALFFFPPVMQIVKVEDHTSNELISCLHL